MNAEPTPTAAPAPAKLALGRILAPTDFSECGRKAALYALRLAEQAGARLTLLHVLDLPAQAYGMISTGDGFLSGEEIEQFYRGARRQAEARLAAAKAELPATGVTIETALEIGRPAEHIIEQAGKLPADLVVLGTHGYSGLKHLLLGSTAERVVRGAPCPVLVVREHERDFVAD
ncbi:MAG: universal stress protein [Verrucomicrobia bacterium]|nr:universal stress protein [Verrucomicrobiota bacterium]